MSDVKNSSLATDLVSYWELEEASGTRFDSHGANDLTDNNTVGQATGKIGNGADFEDGNSESLSDVNTGQYTSTVGSFACWVKVENLKTSDFSPSIVSTIRSNADDTGGMVMRYSFVDQKVNWFKGNSVGGYTASTTALTSGSWFHIVGTWDSSEIKIYVNGTLEGTNSSVSASTTAGNLTIGSDTVNTARRFDGVIDEVGFWSKVLTSTEVSDLYNSGAGIPYDAGGPAAQTARRGAVMMM